MNHILDAIDSPAQLKRLSCAQLEQLAGEVRSLIIRTVSKNGGHLAPSLGAVDLTVALHAVFHCPEDKIVWDVGHQAYGHKILTGRRDAFDTLRRYGGITGFPKRDESACDSFGVGHSSTSISAALGMALARDLDRKNHFVIAVIGDGALTGGEAFEALNNAGQMGKRLIVILNDNEMSIDKNVGAVSEYLSKMRTAPTYHKAKKDLEGLLKRIPAIGDSVAKTVEHVKDSFRFFLVPGGLFEELGFTYVGPIDGHNIALMTDVMEKAKTMEGPVLIHAITKKGKGYLPAEIEPDKFHGVGPFDMQSGKLKANGGSAPAYTSVFSKALIDLARANRDIVAITAAMPSGTGLKKFGETFPDRFFDVGIAEQHAVTCAAGLAAQGKKPVVAIYSTFAQRAYDQILHDICLQNLSVVFVLDRAGIVGEDGPTHHGLFDFSYLRHMPNMTLMAPKDENELRQMLYTALTINGPAALRFPRGAGLGVDIADEFEGMPVGKAEVLRAGGEICFLAAGAMTAVCLKAADLLKEQGIDAGVVNARFIKPLDGGLLQELAARTRGVITVEDNVLQGGFGSAALEYFSDHCPGTVRLLRMGFPDQFIEQGTRAELLEKYHLTGEAVAAKALDFARRLQNKG